jgi:hypothetical protein
MSESHSCLKRSDLQGFHLWWTYSGVKPKTRCGGSPYTRGIPNSLLVGLQGEKARSCLSKVVL